MLFPKLYRLQRKLILKAYGPLIVLIPTLFLPKLLHKEDLEKRRRRLIFLSFLWQVKWFLLPIIILIAIAVLYNSYLEEKTFTNNINLFEWHWVGQTSDNVTHLRLLNNCKEVSENCKTDAIHILSASYNKKGKIIKHALKSQISNQKKSSANLLVQPSSGNPVFLTYRLETLNGKKGIRTIVKQIRSDIKILKKTNVALAGIEFSYDSPSSKLLDYMDWLESFRQSLDKSRDSWTIQVGEFSNKKNAEKLKQTYETIDPRSTIKSIKRNNKIMHQVMIGPIYSIREAFELRGWLKNNFNFNGIINETSTALSSAPLWITGLPAWHTDKPTYLHELTQVVDGISFQLYETDKNIIPNQNLLEFVKNQKNAHIGLYCFDKKILSNVLLGLEPERNISVGIFNNATCL